MEVIQNQILMIISNARQNKGMEEVIEVLTSLFECLNNENNTTISDIMDLWVEINYSISDSKDDIST